ncbi:head decoration protein [Beijerinckia sp. L45]|uniref:head decoration protein n=1 Tax=Beijerinckia sp. L45 TaxID=1641855 RepID=UPI00131C9053|nr:head decoration protein [Beijerinckia sp. L45]
MSSYTFPKIELTPLFAGDFPIRARQVTIPAGSNAAGTVLERGTILGLVTANGNGIVSVLAATDGSQNPKCILADDIDASTVAVSANAYFTGDFADIKCIFGTGHTAATVNASFAESGQPIFIHVVGTVA